MLALDGRVWFLDGDSLALREAPEIDAARYFHGDPPPPANAGIDWQAPGLTRLPDGRLLILASDHEARALERGEALPAANQRARRQRLSLGTLDWRSPAENRLRPLLDAAFLQAGLLPDPAAAEEPQRLLDRPSERQRQHPSLPPEPQPPEEFDERVERFPSTRAFLAARDAYRQERRRWDCRARCLAGTGRRPGGGGGCRVPSPARRADARGGVVPSLCASALPGGDSRLARRPWRVDGNWLVLHRRSLAERSELLLSSVSADGSLLWTWSCPSSVPSGCSAWMPTTCFSAAVERKAGGWVGRSAPGQRHRPSPRARRRHCSGSSGPKANRDRLRPAWWLPSGGRAPIRGS